MEFYDVIKKRMSISKYKGDDVLSGSLDNMIEAAMRSPSWKNKTSFKLIIVDDCNIKEEIGKYVLNEDLKAESALKEAPIAVVFISEPEKSGKIDNKELYIADAAIAMEHFILAATAEGYGTMWIGAIDEENIKKLLNIPKEFKVIGVTPVGISAEMKKHNAKKDIKDYVFKNNFNTSYN